MIRTICALSLALFLAACGGGGGGGGGSSSTTTPPVALTNFAAITVDAGPAALQVGANGYSQDNVAYVSVTLCAPGSTTNCQTIDHIQVDTGSVGLRIFGSVLNSSLLSALPTESDSSSNPVGECYTYIDGYVFGSVRQADFTVGGESVSSMPLQILADTGQFSNVPSTCSAGGGSNFNTVQSFGSNGIIGIGATTTDCGTACESTNGQPDSAAIYYDCPTAGCSAIIARTATTTAPFQQLPNPVAAMKVDNNGTIITLPSVASAGQSTVSGTIYFGIGTQTNNTLGAQTVLTTTTSTSELGPGLITSNYNGQVLNESFIDSGSNSYLFINSAIPVCSSTDFTGYYCPTAPTTVTSTIQGQNGATTSGTFTLYNAQTQLSTSNSVVPGIAANPTYIPYLNDYQNSFDYGLTFFYGRSVYTAIEGRTAGSTVGPYVAF